MKTTSHSKANWSFVVLALFITMASFSGPTFAAFTVGSGLLADVISWLKITAVAICTIAFMFIGYRMMFAAAQWKDVAPIFWGAVLIGSAAIVAPLLTA